MSKLPDLITNSLTGSTFNYFISGDIQEIEFEEKFTVVKDSLNFKWTVNVELFCKRLTTSQYGRLFSEIWIRIGNNYKYLSNSSNEDDYALEVAYHGDSSGNNGIFVNNIKIQSNPFIKTKIHEYSIDIDCTPNGNYGLNITCGFAFEYQSTSRYYFSDYTITYLTLPSFSGAYIKNNNEYKKAMVWKKVNGVWKRCLQHKKINNEWVDAASSWRFEP